MPTYRCPCIVDRGRAHDPCFVYRIQDTGPEFEFSLAFVDETKRDWMAGLVMCMLDRAFDHGQQSQRDETRDALEELLSGIGIQIPQGH